MGPHHSAALAILNRRDDGTPTRVSAVLSDLGLISLSGYQVEELFDGNNLGFHRAEDKLTFNVNPSGIYLYFFNYPFGCEGLFILPCVCYRCCDGQGTVQKKKKLFNRFSSLKDNALF